MVFWLLLHSRYPILGFTKQTGDLKMQHYMTQNEVAERIGVTRQTINNWLRSGKFPDCCIKVMGRRLPGTFDRNKVEEWIKENVK
nr:MAG: pyocin activator protein [Bacteriophage sp.]UVX44248.1 MAG: Pyocin activator protein PrtN [Bacteriophage sp.]